MSKDDMRLVGKRGQVSLYSWEDSDGRQQYFYEHNDKRWFTAPFDDFDSHEQALEYCEEFDHTYAALTE